MSFLLPKTVTILIQNEGHESPNFLNFYIQNAYKNIIPK